MEGLAWVLAYYYQGCASWNWFYPFHYSPFASDFEYVSDPCFKFEKAHPFKPFEQLMAVLPAGSKELIPEPFHRLMTDQNSEVIDFYPQDFQIDLNGKKFAWQGVALLPFIDEKRLLHAMEKVYDELSEEEKIMNMRGEELLFANSQSSIGKLMCRLYEESIPEMV